MRARSRRLLFLVALGATVAWSREEPNEDLVLGTWVLDLAESTYRPGPPPKSQKRTYEPHGEGVKATITTVDAEGRTLSAEYVADYDSLEYPLTGSTQIDAIALKRVNDTTAEATLTHARKVIGTARRVISPDGKTMTITFKGNDPQGRAVHNVAVYRKEGSPEPRE
ncbi:MAG: hypothetical protein ACRD21_13225 [Vicinamibacteria bacterium]